MVFEVLSLWREVYFDSLGFSFKFDKDEQETDNNQLARVMSNKTS